MGVVKHIISIPFNYIEQNGYLKILIRRVLGIDGRRCGGEGFAIEQSPKNLRVFRLSWSFQHIHPLIQPALQRCFLEQN